VFIQHLEVRDTVKNILKREGKKVEVIVNIVFYGSMGICVLSGLIKFIFFK